MKFYYTLNDTLTTPFGKGYVLVNAKNRESADQIIENCLPDVLPGLKVTCCFPEGFIGEDCFKAVMRTSSVGPFLGTIGFTPADAVSTVFVYKRWNSDNFGDVNSVEVKTFIDRWSAVSYLGEEVEKAYGAPIHKLRDNPDFDEDTLDDDLVVVENDGGDVSCFVVEEAKLGNYFDV